MEKPSIETLQARIAQLEAENATYRQDAHDIAVMVYRILEALGIAGGWNVRAFTRALSRIAASALSGKTGEFDFIAGIMPLIEKYKHLVNHETPQNDRPGAQAEADPGIPASRP